MFVRLNDIEWIEAAHNYVELHMGKETHLLRQTLNAIEARLAPDKFVRISRSTIVNLERIKELQPLFRGDYAVTLQNGTQLTLSRRYRDKLQQLGLGLLSSRPALFAAPDFHNPSLSSRLFTGNALLIPAIKLRLIALCRT